MTNPQGTGPYESLPLVGGDAVPLYLIRFDKKGALESPEAVASVLAEVARGDYTDVHLFSHGWNNVFADALTLYRSFFANYFKLREGRGISNPARYRPVLIGVIWPSTLLVAPWESGPRIAAVVAAPEIAAADEDALREVSAALPQASVARLSEFAHRAATLSPGEATELAELLLPVYRNVSADEGIGDTAPEIEPADLVRLWSKIFAPVRGVTLQPGFAPEAGASPAQPVAAGLRLTWLDPRNPVRVASVLLMKDRAGTVGAHGVGPALLDPILASGNARVHLIGHSYGAKVVLSALCFQPKPRPVDTLLLLEPAVSYLCFADRAGQDARRGGYRDALDRVSQPLLSTFSRADAPLTKFFHLAVIRESDWGEQKIAGAPPNRFAALGGFGPRGLCAGESTTIDMPGPGQRYPRAQAGIRIYGVDGSSGQIKGHGDVATDYTAWAHLNLVSGGESK
jgi:hypothetical protein